MKNINKKNLPETLWHYTRGEFLPLIEDSGFLTPQSEADIHKLATGKGTGKGNVKLLWFSSNQNWEPFTAQLGNGLKRGLTWQQLANHYKAIRFGISSNYEDLLDWQQTCSIGGGNREERRAREKVSKSAKKLGADVNGWYTSLKPIPLEDFRLQMWIQGEWSDC